MIAKSTLRAILRQRRARLGPVVLRAASDRIQRAILRLPEWRQARRVCLYLALPGEPRTARLLRACRESGRMVLIPAYNPAARRYMPARLDPDTVVRPGRGSVPEPVRPRWAPRLAVDLVIVPGLAFDRSGRRLGRGGGHYDRLLAGRALRGAFKIGLALEAQVAPRVPAERHDVAMDAVATEAGIWRAPRSAGRRTGTEQSCRQHNTAPRGRGGRTQ